MCEGQGRKHLARRRAPTPTAGYSTPHGSLRRTSVLMQGTVRKAVCGFGRERQHRFVLACLPTSVPQLVDEMLAFWKLEDYEDSLEELEEVLIVS